MEEHMERLAREILDLGDGGLIFLLTTLRRKGLPLIKITPQIALDMAIHEGPMDFLREVCCTDPEYAYRYAIMADRRPHDRTREVASEDPRWAFDYAMYVDKRPHDVTRTGACQEPDWASRYAVQIDRGAHPETRKAVCRGSGVEALNYARNYDKGWHEDMWQAVKGTVYEQGYEHFLGGPPHAR